MENFFLKVFILPVISFILPEIVFIFTLRVFCYIEYENKFTFIMRLISLHLETMLLPENASTI